MLETSFSKSISIQYTFSTFMLPSLKLLSSPLVTSSDPYTLEASTNAVMAFICSLVVSGSSQNAVDLVNSRQVWAVERLE